MLLKDEDAKDEQAKKSYNARPQKRLSEMKLSDQTL